MPEKLSVENIDIKNLSKLQEEWRILPTNSIVSLNDGKQAGPGYKMEVKMKKWHCISVSSKSLTDCIQKGLAKLHNSGYIDLYE